MKRDGIMAMISLLGVLVLVFAGCGGGDGGGAMSEEEATEIAEQIKLPESLRRQYHNRGYYGTVRHNSRAVYQAYFGWYDDSGLLSVNGAYAFFSSSSFC